MPKPIESSGSSHRKHDFALSPEETGKKLDQEVLTTFEKELLEDTLEEVDIPHVPYRSHEASTASIHMDPSIDDSKIASSLLQTGAGWFIGVIGVLVGGLAKLATGALLVAGTLSLTGAGALGGALSVGLALLAALVKGLYAAIWEKKPFEQVVDDMRKTMKNTVQYGALVTATAVAVCFSVPLLITTGIEKCASKLQEIPGWKDAGTPDTIMESLGRQLPSDFSEEEFIP
jgi:hypothetical protein